MDSRQIERNLPDGWSYDHVFGAAAETMELRSLPAPLLKQASGQAVGLPRGATTGRFQLLLGAVALLAALVLILLARRFSGPGGLGAWV